jgi:hypothetical protein
MAGMISLFSVTEVLQENAAIIEGCSCRWHSLSHEREGRSISYSILSLLGNLKQGLLSPRKKEKRRPAEKMGVECNRQIRIKYCVNRAGLISAASPAAWLLHHMFL